jgi:ribosomal protein S27E
MSVPKTCNPTEHELAFSLITFFRDSEGVAFWGSGIPRCSSRQPVFLKGGSEMKCKHCGLPIEHIVDPWGGKHGWYHPTLERETNIDGADVMIYAASCESGDDEAEPMDSETVFTER